MWLDEMTREIDRYNGGTFRWYQSLNSWVETEFPDGYWVSLAGGIENLPKLREQVLHDFVDARPKIRRGEVYLGCWNSLPKTPGSLLENWSVDETVWVENKNDALIVARDNNQNAIYEIKTDSLILVN